MQLSQQATNLTNFHELHNITNVENIWFLGLEPIWGASVRLQQLKFSASLVIPVFHKLNANNEKLIHVKPIFMSFHPQSFTWRFRLFYTWFNHTQRHGTPRRLTLPLNTHTCFQPQAEQNIVQKQFDSLFSHCEQAKKWNVRLNPRILMSLSTTYQLFFLLHSYAENCHSSVTIILQKTGIRHRAPFDRFHTLIKIWNSSKHIVIKSHSIKAQRYQFDIL